MIDKPIAFLGERDYAFWTVTGVAIWHDLGINMVFFLAALQTVSRDLYEAAMVDGARAGNSFRDITIPAIRPITAVIVMLSLAGSLKVFDYFAVMTGGGPGFRRPRWCSTCSATPRSVGAVWRGARRSRRSATARRSRSGSA